MLWLIATTQSKARALRFLIYDDRLEVKSPGGLLSSISIQDLRTGKRTHQSRNAYLARVLREFGYMREMGEGMLRIFVTMRDRDLVPPELHADASRFDMILHHRSVFSPKDEEWLRAYVPYMLSRAEQRAILLGRDGHKLSTKEIMKALEIVDTDEFRQVVEKLRRKGILLSERVKAGGSRRRREVGRFTMRPPDQTEAYRQELLKVLRALGPRSSYSGGDIVAIKQSLSVGNPFAEAPLESLKLLGLLDETLHPLPSLSAVWKDLQKGETPVVKTKEIPKTFESKVTIPSSSVPFRVTQASDVGGIGTIRNLHADKGFGFIRPEKLQTDVYFHRTSLADREKWGLLREGMKVKFEYGFAQLRGKARPASRVELLD